MLRYSSMDLSFGSLVLVPVFILYVTLKGGFANERLEVIVLTYVFSVIGLAQALFQGLLFGIGSPSLVGVGALLSPTLFIGFILSLPAASDHDVLLAAVCSGGLTAGLLIIGAHIKVWPAEQVGCRDGLRRAMSFGKTKGRQLLGFGTKSVLNSGMLQIGLWLIQARLLHDQGSREVAIYGIGQQFYNVVIFLPILVGPILLAHYAESCSRGRGDRRLVGWALAVFAAVCVGIVIGYEVLGPYVLQFLPSIYRNSGAVIFWSILGGVCVFLKAPISIYFQSHLRVLPETLGTTVAAAVLIMAAVYGVNSAVEAVIVRFCATALQAVLVLAVFLFQKGTKVVM